MTDAELRTMQATEAYERRSEFEAELRELLNANNAESGSGTPDVILARYLLSSLDNFNEAVRGRDSWWNYHPRIGGSVPAYEQASDG